MRFASTHAPNRLPTVVAVAVALNVLLFFKPINKTAKAASYKELVHLNTYIEEIIDPLEAFRAQGHVTAVSPAFVSGWRTVSYYLPDVSMLVIDSGRSAAPQGLALVSRPAIAPSSHCRHHYVAGLRDNRLD